VEASFFFAAAAAAAVFSSSPFALLFSCCLGLELAGRSEASATLRRADHYASSADSGSERIGVEEGGGFSVAGGGGRASGGGGGVRGGIGGDDSSKSATAVAMPLLEVLASWSVDVFGTARGCREASGVEFGRFHRRRRRRKKTGSRGDADDGLPLVLAIAADAA